MASILETALAAGAFNTLLAAVDAAGLRGALEGPGPLARRAVLRAQLGEARVHVVRHREERVQVVQPDAQLLRGLVQANFCYLYAPAFHPAFKAVLGVRKKIAESGTKTDFNVLGPLINPAQPAHMVVGVYDERWVEPLAATLGELGVKRGLVTHSRAGGGMDEITTAGEVRVRGCGELASVDAVWLPGDFGFKTCTVADLRGGTPEENISMFSDLLVGGVSDGLMDTLCLSAGASLWVAGKATDPTAGAQRAREIILGGELREEARRLREAYRAD